jgi:hypothetical protein
MVRTRASASGGGSRLSRRRRTTIGLLAAAAPLLTACGAGFDAQTNQVYQPAVGVNDRSGDVFVINALVVTDGSGSGTVVASLVNTAAEDDALTEVVATATSGAPLEASALGAGIDIPAGDAVQLADEGVTVSTTAVAEGSGSEQSEGGVTAGSFVTLQFVFERAQVVELHAPVVSNESEHHDMYEDVPLPTPSTTE